MKKVLSVLLVAVILCGCLASCAKPGNNEVEHKGTIMWLSHISSGTQFDCTVKYGEAICKALGYDFLVVFGDTMADAANNLAAVKNAMTDDVVGLMTSHVNGLSSIMEEYPNLWVCGFACDMRPAYDEGGTEAAAFNSDHFLGTICDGALDGKVLGENFFNAVIKQGFKKVSVINFPAFAYPNQAEATNEFMRLVEEYNKTAAEPITVVGDPLTLMFAPLNESFFLEEGRGDLDAIVSFAAGTQFVLPTMVSAMSNGTCSKSTRLITGGFNSESEIVENIGDDKIIAHIITAAVESPAYALVLLDNAINGCQYSDFTKARIDTVYCVIDSTEDINNTMAKTMRANADVSKALLSVEEVKNLCVRFNPKATHEQLIAIFQDVNKLGTEALK